MDEPKEILKQDTRIRTHDELEDTMGFMIAERHINGRKTNALGLIQNWVPGHGGDVYFVRHTEGDSKLDPSPVAAYSWLEFELAPPE